MDTQDDHANPWQRLRTSVKRFFITSLSLISSCGEHDKTLLEENLAELNRETSKNKVDLATAIVGLMALKENSANHDPKLSLLQQLTGEVQNHGNNNEKI